MQTICLNMIVKNEASIIATLLKSVKDVINYYVIVDTGSNLKGYNIGDKVVIQPGIFNKESKTLSTNNPETRLCPPSLAHRGRMLYCHSR